MNVKDMVRWIRSAVDGVVAQTWTDLEFVVTDDGSTDGTVEFLRSLRDPRIRLLENERNLGISRCAARALAEARGEFVARIDGDDVWEPGRLAAGVAHLTARPDCDVVASRVLAIDSDGRTVSADWDQPTDESLVLWNLLLFTNPVCHSASLFRREAALAAGGYDPSIPCSEDRDLWTRMLPTGRIQVIETPLVRFRRHPTSFTAERVGAQRAASIAIRRRALAWLLGPGADSSAIERWYDGRLTRSRAEALVSLFRRTFDALPATGRCTPEGLALVREDLARREESVRRRVRPGLVARVLRKFR